MCRQNLPGFDSGFFRAEQSGGECAKRAERSGTLVAKTSPAADSTPWNRASVHARILPDCEEKNMRRDIFTPEHEMFRAQVAKFVDNEIAPKIESWNRNGMSDRESWRKMGAAGFLGANAPAEYGGAGADFAYDAIVNEELARVRAHGLMMGLHSDICMPYITTFGNEAQKKRYLTGAIAGEIILAIAMTEPGTGSG